MIDIFDIINTRKTKRINIEGTIDENYLTVFSIKTLDDLCDAISSFINNDTIEIKTFSIESYDVFTDNNGYSFGPRSITIDDDIFSRDEFIFNPRGANVRPRLAKDFKIDIKLTDEVYDSIYKRFENFIDYYTVGAIHTNSMYIDSFDLGNYSLYNTLDSGITLGSVLTDETVIYDRPIITGRRH